MSKAARHHPFQLAMATAGKATWRILLLGWVILGSIASPHALADSKAEKAGGKGSSGEGLVNKLLAPGPLIFGHRNLEHGDCLKCHDAGQGVPDNKCLSCHTDITKSMADKKSFHALTKKACFECHSDHKGRDFDTTKVDTSSFNHALTTFALKGAHAKAQCASCHTAKRTGKHLRSSGTRFLGLEPSCKACHKKDDPHRFPPKLAAKECSACHNETSWKGTDFDHKRETGYSLLGNHAKLPCKNCHETKNKTPRYDFPGLASKKCLTCHEDHHRGGLGPRFSGGSCDRCHTQTEWRLPRFDHASTTGFALLGQHAKQPCAACHKQQGGVTNHAAKGFKFTGINRTCTSCHTDYHGFRNETNPKIGALSNCKSCHDEAGWRASLQFNHNVTPRFPIEGKHKQVACFSCHTPLPGQKGKLNVARTYNWPQLDSKTCETCHKNPHTKSPSPIFRNNKCSSCHTPEGWHVFGKGTVQFNHNAMTRFKLTGSHIKLSCNQCHNRGGKDVYRFGFANRGFCESCHAGPHKNQFTPKFAEQACQACHNTQSFKNLLDFDHTKTNFQLSGAHAKLNNQCARCHIPTKKMLPVKPPRPAGKFQFEHEKIGYCVGCHRNPHKDQFSSRFPSNDCRQCHNVQSFSQLLDFDHNKTRFKIDGAHIKFKNKCGECHVRTNKLLPTNPPKPAGKFQFTGESRGFCESCHKDVHQDQFSQKFKSKPCTECHTTHNFTERKPFNHSQTAFKLTGSHQKLAERCESCHVLSGKQLPTTPPKPARRFQFSGEKNGFCSNCHPSVHSGQFRSKIAAKPCRECHTTVAFDKNQHFDHALARFLLKGKHIKVSCGKCHVRVPDRYKVKPFHKKGKFLWPELRSKDCALCHKDPHAGRFGKRCSECHTEDGWELTAEYHKAFALQGVHLSLDCGDCHRDRTLLSGMGSDCLVCHAKDDPHRGSLPECKTCHEQHVWEKTQFQHAMTDFPLRGAHRLANCTACHGQGVYQGLPSDCQGCHILDAAKVSFPNHKVGGFEDCQRCHNQFSFPGARQTP